MPHNLFDHQILLCDNNQTLYQQGESHAFVYWIEQGFVTLQICDAEGKTSITDLLGAGDFFGPGLMEVASSDRRLADLDTGAANHGAVAKAGTRLRVVPAKAFWQRAETEITLNRSLVTQLLCVQQRLQQQLFLQQTGTLEQRLAHLLYSLFDRLGLECSHGHLMDIRFSQQELADMVGGSRQTVSQILADWRRTGMIDYTRSYICLEDPDRLRQCAQ